MNRNMIRFMFLFFVLLATDLSFAGELKGNLTLEIIGTGHIQDNDVANARQKAIDNALGSAVEQATGRFVSQEVMINNFQILSDRIFNPVQKFTSGFQVLVEAQSGELYRVMVRANVSLDAIKTNLNEIGISSTKKSLPAILFFISEQNIDSDPYKWWVANNNIPAFNHCEKTVGKKMLEKNFLIFDRKKISKQILADPAFQTGDADPAIFLSFAKQKQVELIVVGTAQARLTPGIIGMDLTSAEGEVSLRVYRVENGALLAETKQTARSVNSSESVAAIDAVSQASLLAAEELATMVTTGIKHDASKPKSIELIITGTRNLPNFVAFRTMLTKDLQGIKAVRLKELKADQARIEVDFPESSGALEKALMVKSFENFGISILEVSDTQIRLDLIPKEELSKDTKKQ